MKDSFVSLVREKFRFLEEDYGFKLVSTECDRDTSVVPYQNDTTGVSAYYEPRDSSVWVVLRRLVNGELPGYDDPINTHGLYAIVSLRSPGAWVGEKHDPGPLTPAEMETRIDEQAKALRTHGADILRGDFSIFPKLAEFEQKMAEDWECELKQKVARDRDAQKG
jgi:hypothetical protein